MGDSFSSGVYTPRIQTFVPPIGMDVSVEVREQQRFHWPAGGLPQAPLSKRIKNLRPVSALTPRAAPLIVPSWTKEEMMQVDQDPEGQYDLPPGSARSWGGPERDPAMAATRPHAVGWVAAPSQSWGPVRQRTPRTPLQRTPQPWEVVSLRTPSRPERAATPREGAAYQPGLAQPRAPQAVLRDGRGRPPSGGRMFGPQNERGQQGLEERRRSVGVMERQLARSRTALQRAQSGIESIRRQLRAPTALERPHGPVKEARAAQGGGAGAGARSSDGKAVGEGEGEAELALLEKHRAEHRREVQEYRRALFARPRRSYSREEQENLCRRLIGESDSSRMVQLCAKPPDDRSFEDCETLARIARTCPAMAERWSQTQLHALVRCATVTRLAAGESLQVRGSEDQLVVVVHGLLIPALPVADAAGGMKSIGGERDKPEPRVVRDGNLLVRTAPHASALPHLRIATRNVLKTIGIARRGVPAQESSFSGGQMAAPKIGAALPEGEGGEAPIGGEVPGPDLTEPAAVADQGASSEHGQQDTKLAAQASVKGSFRAAPRPLMQQGSFKGAMGSTKGSFRRAGGTRFSSSFKGPGGTTGEDRRSPTADVEQQEGLAASPSDALTQLAETVRDSIALTPKFDAGNLSYTALQPCELLLVSVQAFQAHVDSWQQDLRFSLWLQRPCASGDRWKAKSWRRVLLLMEAAVLTLTDPRSEELLLTLQLSVGRTAARAAPPGEHAAAQAVLDLSAELQGGGTFEEEGQGLWCLRILPPDSTPSHPAKPARLPRPEEHLVAEPGVFPSEVAGDEGSACSLIFSAASEAERDRCIEAISYYRLEAAVQAAAAATASVAAAAGSPDVSTNRLQSITTSQPGTSPQRLAGGEVSKSVTHEGANLSAVGSNSGCTDASPAQNGANAFEEPATDSKSSAVPVAAGESRTPPRIPGHQSELQRGSNVPLGNIVVGDGLGDSRSGAAEDSVNLSHPSLAQPESTITGYSADSQDDTGRQAGTHTESKAKVSTVEEAEPQTAVAVATGRARRSGLSPAEAEGTLDGDRHQAPHGEPAGSTPATVDPMAAGHGMLGSLMALRKCQGEELLTPENEAQLAERFSTSLARLHDRLERNRIVQLATFLQQLEILRGWGWKEVAALAQLVQVRRFRRGEIVFRQGERVTGLYALRRGCVKLLNVREAEEVQLRFPGREDLVMEEDLELQRRFLVRSSLLGACEAGAVFGEEAALEHRGGGGGAREHLFQVEAEGSSCEVLFIPWESWHEDRRFVASAVARTMTLLSRNAASRSLWAQKRSRHLRALEFLLEVNRHRHLNESAYLRAATEIDRLMALEAAILPPGSHFKTRGAEGGKKHAAKKHNRTNKAGGSTAQYCDVEAAEAAARKTMENLQFIQRAARSPMQENALRRAVSSMKEELEAMVSRIRDTFEEQQRVRMM